LAFVAYKCPLGNALPVRSRGPAKGLTKASRFQPLAEIGGENVDSREGVKCGDLGRVPDVVTPPARASQVASGAESGATRLRVARDPTPSRVRPDFEAHGARLRVASGTTSSRLGSDFESGTTRLRIAWDPIPASAPYPSSICVLAKNFVRHPSATLNLWNGSSSSPKAFLRSLRTTDTPFFAVL
jgi:hypothetical protein